MAKAAKEEVEVEAETEVAAPQDSGTKISEALVVLTGLMLVAAIFTMLHLLGTKYNEGLLREEPKTAATR